MDAAAFCFEFLGLPEMRRALAVALIAAPVAALLGTFVTLRRMAFFSDAIAHASMTGVTLGLALHAGREAGAVGMQVTLVLFCAAVALLVAWLIERTGLHTDTILAFSYSGSVALGAICISRMGGYGALENALFGDILASSASDIALVGALAVVVIVYLLFNMRGLALAVVHDGLARAEGVDLRRLNRGFVLLVALAVAVLLRQLGALLISGIIVVPAAAARLVAGSFRGMLLWSAGLGTAGAVLGVWGSYRFDSQTGPTIVLTNVLLLTACVAASLAARRRGGRAAAPAGEGGRA